MMAKQKKTPGIPQSNSFGKYVKLKNTSFQGLEVFIKNGRDFESFWLSPGAYVEVMEKDIPDISKNLIRKRMLSIIK